jgi:hypothetical protein
MAKKSKKQVRKVSGNGSATRLNPATSETGTMMSTVSRTSSQEFNPDYSQTIKDLKRIGILASTFFVVLIVIAMFLR